MISRGAAAAVILALLTLVLSSVPLPSLASSPGCGSIITASTTLTADVGSCSGDGLVIGANSITLNCAGHLISGTGYSGVDLTGRAHIKVMNCRVFGFSSGFSFWNATSSIFRGNLAQNDSMGFYGNSGHSGIGFTGGNHLLNNKAVMSSHWGFYVSGDSNTLTNNIATQGGSGGFFIDGSRNKLQSDQARNGPSVSIGFEVGSNCPCGSNVLIHNQAIQNGLFGFLISRGSDKNKLFVNHADSNDRSGFQINADYTTLTGNSATRNGESGYCVCGSYERLQRNTAVNDSADGYDITGTGSVLVHNTASHNQNDGFHLIGAASSVLKSNTASWNGGNGNGEGFELVSSSSNFMGGNSAVSNFADGFYLSVGSGNGFKSNRSDMNSGLAFSDSTSGGGSKGTANSYLTNECRDNINGGSAPAGLCSPQN